MGDSGAPAPRGLSRLRGGWWLPKWPVLDELSNLCRVWDRWSMCLCASDRVRFKGGNALQCGLLQSCVPDAPPEWNAFVDWKDNINDHAFCQRQHRCSILCVHLIPHLSTVAELVGFSFLFFFFAQEKETRQLQQCPDNLATTPRSGGPGPPQPRRLSVCQRVEEREGLVQPPAADFASHHHQACPTVSLSKFGVGAFFPNAGLGHGSPVSCCAFAEPSIRTGDTGVDRELSAVEQGKSISHHFQSAIVGSSSGRQVQILHVRSHSPPGLSADACCNALEGEPPSPQNSCMRTSCVVVSTWIE